MKTFFLLLLTVISTTFLFADPWDDLTREEAEEVVKHLEENPYILDYCDCCDGMEVALLRVTSTEIVTCDWKEEAFSVNAKVEMVALIPRTDDDLDIKKPYMPVDEGPDGVLDFDNDYTVYMNYTFTWDRQSNRAAPFFDVVKYSSYETSIKKPCNNYTDFPAPGSVIKDLGYADWYKRTHSLPTR